jgi:flagellum-specific peptidoglycan hydrolase FlgJ
MKNTASLTQTVNSSKVSNSTQSSTQTKADKKNALKNAYLLLPNLSDQGSKLLKNYLQLGRDTQAMVAELKKLFSVESNIAGKVGQKLGELHQCFLQAIPASKLNSNLGTSLYYRFISLEFGIGKSRTNEYMFLAQREDINGLDLPLSILIELTRLSRTNVEKFFKKNPIKDLKGLSYREIQKLVREMNPNRRNRKKQKKSSSNSAFASKIKDDQSAIQRINGLKTSLRSFYSKEQMSRKVKAEMKSFIKWFNAQSKEVG